MNYSSFLNTNLNKNKKLRNKKQNTFKHKKRDTRKFFLISTVSAIFLILTASLINININTIAEASQTSSTKSIEATPITQHIEIELPQKSSQLSETVQNTDTRPNTIQKEVIVKLPAIIQKPLKSTTVTPKEVIGKNTPSKIVQTANSAVDIEVIPPNNIENTITATANTNKSQTVMVKKGDTLSAIFRRLSISGATLYKILHSGTQANRLIHIKPGQSFIITLTNKNEFVSLNYNINKIESLFIHRNLDSNKFTSTITFKEIDIKKQFATSTIKHSLFSAGNNAGLSNTMIMKLAHIFGWDIDFALDIRKGDSFSILYEEKYLDNKKIGDGNILSAEFINRGKVFTAIRYTDASGHTDYYSAKGLSMRKAFLRSPVDFSRISSRFSTGRKHPVLNRIRAHKGVDYAASRGTPIKAVGDGKVIFKGRKGGYGRVVILQHGSKYTTLYAHMNSYNRKIRRGKQVKQGQIIGYVGSSGLATGPHLHYEFRINGVHRNPLTVPLPSAAPIARKYRNDFQTVADTLISQLKSRKVKTIALSEQ